MCGQSQGVGTPHAGFPPAVPTTAVAVIPPKTFAGLVVDESNEYRAYELIGLLLTTKRITLEEHDLLKEAVDALRKSLNETHC